MIENYQLNRNILTLSLLIIKSIKLVYYNTLTFK